ncbi:MULTISPECIES: CinA family protein [Arcobacteraceae]|uniref:CinA family protein n=1 Tax=Arcobacteraceae TaxID=2808963 RepID=UPI000DEAAC41|nr:CinA family protein [Arcobacter sp. CECT 9188]RBQ27579.1 damage-inducible protein CinA [Arcobacter sp. CECT 9188]
MAKIFSKKDMIYLQQLLRKSKNTITAAESCTGGLVASLITKISGSSDIFNGSIISYSNYIKEKELGVKSKTLNNFGAVSIEVVNEMLDGVIKKFDASFAIAISGVAGPTGGTKNKPVGMVVIGISNNKGLKKVKIYNFKGSREEVQEQAAQTALKQILKFIKKTLDN